DVYDAEFHAQYYYHAHRAESGEHGHFHTFLRSKAMPPQASPVPYAGKAKRPAGGDALAHLVAISMNRPQIEALVTARDETVAQWAREHPDRDVYEDRKLEITSIIAIDADRQIAAVRAALESARAPA
ncbi:MAG TPA: hypothetical protein VMO81_06055, partial [Aestuariivirgaceae bacterium]|nr:hypothetical protein [Aestuariivirgaceae bacterium]